MIKLKSNWSEPFIYGDKSPGYFVGRENEKKSLKSIIENNNSSSILISSVRGVGKTSFVHKTLSEIKNAKPIFVNIGHAISSLEEGDSIDDKQRKLVLTALIRAVYLSDQLKNDKEIEEIYQYSISKYKILNHNNYEKQNENEFNFKTQLSNNIKLFTPELIGVLLIALGVTLENVLLRIIIAVLGASSIFLSYSAKQYVSRKKVFSKETLHDNSTNYLQIRFENWLKKQTDKIVFVIDELDKMDEKRSFRVIKEYKNLFSLSFSHFLFIASEKAYELVTGTREGNLEEEQGKIFPTLFSHIFYLPLPTSDELMEFLRTITLQTDEDDKINTLYNYILFRSRNDFFEIKRTILERLVLINM